MYNLTMTGILAFTKRWVCATFFMSAIFYFSSIPSVDIPDFGLMDNIVKKSGHALGFGILALAYHYGLSGNVLMRNRMMVAASMAFAALYALADEYHQSFIPGRHPSFTDCLIDIFGSGLALIAGWWYNRKK